MAEYFFRQRSANGRTTLSVASAGIAALVGRPPADPVIALMAQRGLDLSSHKARQLTPELAAAHELVLVMEAAQRHHIEQNWRFLKGRVRRLGEWRNEDVADPYGQPEDAYRRCLGVIESYVGDWEARLFG
jgi:low molecular weight protein-tyrosine phosphatase